MKAIIYEQYGSPDVIRFTDSPKPTPNDDEVLIRVYAASLNVSDWYMLTGPLVVRMMGQGFWTPKSKLLGSDLAGQVEAVGKDVTQFKQGDLVFGAKRGALAEFVCAREQALALKPANTTFEQAAAVPIAALTALQGLRDKGHILSGQKVLIYGASGGVGSLAVPIAKSFGTRVTAVCSPRNVDMVRSMGADQVIDYTKEDFLKSGQRYDLILAVNGYRPLWHFARALEPDGIFVAAGGSMPKSLTNILFASILSKAGNKRFRSYVARINQKDLQTLGALLESGKLVPFVEKCYPFSHTQEAFRYIGTGHARGKVVIALGQDQGGTG